MPRKIVLLLPILLLVFLLLTDGYLLLSTTSHPTILSRLLKKESEVNVTARVGNYVIALLSGWSSPYSEITLNGQSLERKTTAREDGFFVFYNVPIVEELKEICLIAQDVNQLPSFPVCLPVNGNQNLAIENILLSPTLSLENGQIATGKTAKSSGMTFPRSKVQVYFFTEKNLSFWARISRSLPFLSLISYHLSPKFAYAANFPIYETVSNENGYFEFSLPANYPSQNRVFVSSIFKEEGRSPKSNTLFFQTMGLGELFKRFLQNLIYQAGIFFSNWKKPYFIILIEIFILLLLITLVVIRKDRDNGNDKREEVTGN